MSHPFLRNLTAWERIGMEMRGLRGKVHVPMSSPKASSENDDLLEIAAAGSVSGIVLVAAAIVILWRFFAQIKAFLQRTVTWITVLRSDLRRDRSTENQESDQASGSRVVRPRNLTDEEIIEMRETVPKTVRASQVNTYV